MLDLSKDDDSIVCSVYIVDSKICIIRTIRLDGEFDTFYFKFFESVKLIIFFVLLA